MGIINESILKTFAIVGLVGVGTLAIDNAIINNTKKKNEVAELPEDVTDNVVEEVADTQECKVIQDTITVDSNKLKNILVEASYPAEAADAFVAHIAKDAKPDEVTVTAETLNSNDTKAPVFTVIKEEKKQPNLKAKTTKSNK